MTATKPKPRRRRKNRKRDRQRTLDEYPEIVQLFAAFCRTLILDNGQRLVLDGWQLDIAEAILHHRRTEVVVLIPKGNGKTTMLAAIALWHILTTHEPRCYIGAASAQQAGEMYLHAKRFVDRDAARNGELSQLVNVQKGYKRIERIDGSGYLEVRAADANTQDGVGPTLALVDEYHRHPSDALYSVFRDGLDKRDGQIVTISTAGDSEESALGHLRAEMRKHIVVDHGRYTYCHNEAGDGVMFEWGLRPADDIEDLDLVLEANPLSSMTIAKLKRRRARSSMTRGIWARLTCNMWDMGDEAAVTAAEWEATLDTKLFGERLEIPEGAEVFLGLDIGRKWDTTAFVPVWWNEQDEVWIVGKATILVPPRDGTSMPYSLIWDTLVDYCDQYRIRLVFDRHAGGTDIARRADEELLIDPTDSGAGLVELVDHPQAPTPMARAAMHTVSLIRDKGLVHGDQPDLTKQITTAAADTIRSSDEEMFRFAKPRRGTARRRRGDERNYACIDAAVALAMALWVAENAEPIDALEPWVA